MHVRAAHLPGSPLSLRFGRVVRAGCLRASVSTLSGEGVLGQTSPYQKMLSCDPRLDLCTFLQLVFLALPCPFVLVVSFERVI